MQALILVFITMHVYLLDHGRSVPIFAFLCIMSRISIATCQFCVSDETVILHIGVVCVYCTVQTNLVLINLLTYCV